MILTREELHRRVWARPMPKVARDLGITTAELERLCKALDVPFPYSGYWRKDAPLDGHPRALPRARPGRPDAVELDLPGAAPSRPAPTPDPRPNTPTDASTPPVAPSPAPNQDADARPEPADDFPEDALDRRWGLIHHRLEEALARAGHTPQVVDGSDGFDVKGQFLSYWLREGYTRTKRSPTAAEARDPWTANRGYVFEERMTGRLILAAQTKAYRRKAEWRDHPRRGRLEDRIDEIVASLEALADDTTRLDAERQAAETRWREAWARREAAERRAQAEADRWARLSRLANQHENTRRVAAFLKRLRAETGPAAGGDPVLRAWFAWAQDALDAYDPVTWDMAQVMRHVDRPPRTRSLFDPPDDDLDDEDLDDEDSDDAVDA